jgi:lipoprotein-releasing system ATP-binding protein
MVYAMNKHSVLTLNNISKDYIQGNSVIEILKNVNLTVMQNELIAIVGSSGSGKSSLLHIAGLLDTPNSGEVQICDIVRKKTTSRINDLIRLNYIGFIYQNYNLLKDFSARENVALPKLIAGSSYTQALEEADELLARLGLSSKIYNMPGELSGGEQQRVAIARSLINKPKLILADEPTGNLDQTTADEVFGILLQIATEQNTSIIMVTHNNELARKMHKLYELRYGVLRLL